MATKKQTPDISGADVPTIQIAGMSGAELVEMLDRQIGESTTFWNSKKYKLAERTKENTQLYLGEQVSANDDGEDPNVALDNRIFSSVRTVVPYTTTRVTEPEVYPSSNKEAAKHFSEDFEKALHIKAGKEKVKKKLKWALEDAMVVRRGYLKLRYDAPTKNWCKIEYVPAESIIVSHRSKGDEELGYFRHLLEKSVDDLITMFPDMKSVIEGVFKITDSSSKASRQATHVINEDWSFITNEQNELDLVCAWSYNKTAFGAIANPNWRYGKTNFLDNHMMPLVEVNVLSDGRTHIDRTSYVEQAKYLQKIIDQRERQIGKNASLGSIGMPVVDSSALADDQAQYMTYDEDTVIELDVTNAGKNSINDVFTTWKAGSLSPDVYTSKTDAVAGVQNAFGASAIQQGNETDNNTLGQDELLRDQSMGRQSEVVDAIDDAMERLYQLMAQFLLVYGEEEELFKAVGENSQFDYIVMHSDDLDTEAEIRVKSGTSMPIDNPQRRATADKAASQAMIDPLTYWEIMDEPNAEKYAKRLVDYTADPPSFLKDTQEEIFNRDAYTDIELLKHSKQPDYRDDLPKEYFDYLNQYILSGDLENPNIALETRQVISQFIDIQLARGQKMLGMAETQLPTPDDINQHNQQVDEANAASAAAMKGMPPAPAQPGAAPPPPVQ
jgi:hypothetical protein